MVFVSKKDKKENIESDIEELTESINKLNKSILKKRKKKNEIIKDLSDSSAELIYSRTLLKQFERDLKEFKD